jgi:hypothetical protein
MADSSNNVIDFEQHRKEKLNEQRNLDRIKANAENKNSVQTGNRGSAANNIDDTLINNKDSPYARAWYSGGKNNSKTQENNSSNRVSQERQNKLNLAAARAAQASSVANSSSKKQKSNAQRMENAAKTLASGTITGTIGFSLLKQVDWLIDWMIFIPLIFAMLKDLLNYVGFNLPGINEVFSFSIGLLLFLILMVLGSKQRSSFRKYIANLVGMVLEEIFGLNYLPIETLTVLVCYAFVLIERLEASQASRENLEEGEEEYAETG